MPDPAPKPVSASRAEMLEPVLPGDANTVGSVLGGRVMHYMDMVAAVAAQRHAGACCVTASVDRIDFLEPAHVGDVLVLKASVNYAGRTSMEVGVLCMAENPRTGERRHTASAYFTFVALDDDLRPTPVPKITPETPVEQRRYREAEQRRASRLSSRASGEAPDTSNRVEPTT